MDSDGLFSLNPTTPNAPLTAPFHSYNKRCAQSQLEVDYNGTLTMVQRATPTQNNQLQRYIMDAPNVTGQWFSRVAYRAENPTSYNPYATGFDIDHLSRQIDGWDYRFGGTIYGPDMVQVANGGCLMEAVITTSETYRAPAIDASKATVAYYWEVYENGVQLTIPNNTGSSITVPFSTTPNKTYWVYLRTTISEAGYSSFVPGYDYAQHSLMGVFAHNGCFGGGSRLAQNLEPKNKALIYPNPVTNNDLTIKLPTDYNQATLEIFDLQGRLVKQSIQDQKEEALNVSDLSNGVYLLNIKTPEFTKKEKIVIAR